MKHYISQLIDDFHERELPRPVTRGAELHDIPGKANVVIGMRRAGKTWFCYQKIQELMASGTVLQKILYLNFEDDRLLDFTVKDFQDILDVYFGKYPDHRSGTCYFFFDEIQRIEQWEHFIRRLVDTENIRIVLTGSSSKLLSSEIATSLRGRSLTTEIFPLSFEEFLAYHDSFSHPPSTFGARTASRLRKAFREYLDIGGFPEVQGKERALRIEILQGYIDSVLLRDIIERHGIANVQALKFLVRHCMSAAGGKFSVNKFYNTLKSMSVKCTKNSLYDYLDYLADSFVIYRVPIYSRSEKARQVNPAKLYAVDTGLLNAMTFRNARDHGHLLENMVYMHLRRRGYETEYVTTDDGRETDFLARHRTTGDRQLIQVCWDMTDESTFKRELAGLKSAMKELSISDGTIITADDERTIDKDIQVIPAWKWLLHPPTDQTDQTTR